MKTLFSGAEGIPQFINAMEAAQRKSKRAKLVIHDEYMHAVALKLLLQSGEYETETREWSKLPEDKQTWSEWKTTFWAAYVAKRRVEAAWEGEEKPFGGSALFGAAPEKPNRKLRRQDRNKTEGTPQLKNQMLDSLEGYLDNIAAAATQTTSNGGPLTELAASLATSVDTVARQQQEIKSFSGKNNALKKKGASATSGATFQGGNNNISPRCAAVGRTELHRRNSCYFDPRKMMDIKDWSRQLMEEKEVKFKEDE